MGERSVPPLTNRQLLEITPPDNQKIVSEHYDRDARLDASAIQRWRDWRCSFLLPGASSNADLKRT
jgi:hypothetical protein